MRHRQERWLDAYIDGELPVERAAALEEHVRGCADCRVGLEDRQRLLRRLRAISSTANPGPSPDPALLDRLFQPDRALDDDADWATLADGYGHRSTLRRMAPALASVAVMVLVAGVLGAAWLLGGPERSTLAAADAVSAAWADEPAALDSEDIARLRAAGWNCPEFTHIGLALVKATGERLEGSARLSLEFSGAAGELRVTERRMDADGMADALAFGGADAVPRPSPSPARGVQPMSGDETILVAGERASIEPEEASGATQAASVEMESAAYEVQSTLGQRVTEAVLRRIVVTEHSKLVPGGAEDPDAWERIGRGMARLMIVDTER